MPVEFSLRPEPPLSVSTDTWWTDDWVVVDRNITVERYCPLSNSNPWARRCDMPPRVWNTSEMAGCQRVARTRCRREKVFQ